MVADSVHLIGTLAEPELFERIVQSEVDNLSAPAEMPPGGDLSSCAHTVELGESEAAGAAYY